MSSATPQYADIGGIQVQLNYQHRLDAVNRQTHPDPFLLTDELKKYISRDEESKDNQSSSISFSSSASSFKHHIIYGPTTQFSLTFHHGQRLTSAYHTQPYEEWYYVLEGCVELNLIDAGEFKSMTLKKGDCYLVTANIPKAVQQTKDTQLLCMSLQRHYHSQSSHHMEEPLQEQDEYAWFCHKCAHPVFQYKFKTNEQAFSEYHKAHSAFLAASSHACPSCSTVYDIQAEHKTHQVPSTVEELKSIVQQPSAHTNFRKNLKIDQSTHFGPYSLAQWVQDNLHLLKPPVGNKMIHGNGCSWKVMIVGGPNERTDYHIDDGEEWFYMLKGDMTLKIVDNGVFRDVHILEGQSYLLPGHVPHSPQRKADTIGLVLERDRESTELDGLRWYCSGCKNVLQTFSFPCADLGSQLKVLITNWYAPESIQMRTCPTCGTVEEKPKPKQG